MDENKQSMMIDTESGMEQFENLEIARLTAENGAMRLRHANELQRIATSHDKEVSALKTAIDEMQARFAEI